MRELQDEDIRHAVAQHPEFGILRFERIRQDRRYYYRLLSNGRVSGVLTTAKGARETINYYRVKGWLFE